MMRPTSRFDARRRHCADISVTLGALALLGATAEVAAAAQGHQRGVPTTITTSTTGVPTTTTSRLSATTAPLFADPSATRAYTGDVLDYVVATQVFYGTTFAIRA